MGYHLTLLVIVLEKEKPRAYARGMRIVFINAKPSVNQNVMVDLIIYKCALYCFVILFC
jgi:hypothetical protein